MDRGGGRAALFGRPNLVTFADIDQALTTGEERRLRVMNEVACAIRASNQGDTENDLSSQNSWQIPVELSAP